jgi:hypothetical protein
MPGRILQVYVGLQWSSTVMQASTALTELTTEDQRARAMQQAAFQKRAQARSQIEADLAEARDRLSMLTDEADFAKRVDGLAEAVIEATASYNEAERRLAETEDEARVFRETAAPTSPLGHELPFPRRSQHPICGYANRSLSHAEPVSGRSKRKLENGEQRPAPKTRRLGTASASFPDRRLWRVCLNL